MKIDPLMSHFQNLIAAEVTRLKHPEDQSLLTSAATVLKEPHRTKHCSTLQFVV